MRTDNIPLPVTVRSTLSLPSHIHYVLHQKDSVFPVLKKLYTGIQGIQIPRDAHLLVPYEARSVLLDLRFEVRRAYRLIAS